MGPSDRKTRENNSGLIDGDNGEIGESQGGYLVKCHFGGYLIATHMTAKQRGV